jgi:hypothetical protein
LKVELIKKLAESRFVKVKRPVNFDPSDEHWFLPWEDYPTNDQEIFIFRDANVTDKGVVFDLLHKFNKTFVAPQLIEKFNKLYLLKVNLFYKKVIADADQVCVLAFDPWSARNYYHWVVDALPRLFIIREKLHDSIVLLPRNARRYMYESVQLFKPKGTLELKKHTYARVKNLYLPRPVADSGRHDGAVLMGLKKFILSGLGRQTDKVTTGERIYISRANQRARRIRNELAVQDLLKSYDFSAVYFENMPFEEQLNIMRNAKYVVSNHGANLTNILFMPEGGKILEINRNISPNLCYYSLASSIDLDYFYQFCPIACEHSDNHDSADLLVDIDKLRENVEMMLLH